VLAIYLDAVWLLNFLIDYMLLMLTARLARVPLNRFRLAFGAFVASLIVPFTIYYPDAFFTTVPAKIIFSFIIVLASFGMTKFYQLMKLLGLFYLISFSIGGGLLAMHFLMQQPVSQSSGSILTFSAGYGDPVSWLFVFIGFPLVWKFTKDRMDKHVQDKIRYDARVPVTLKMNGKSFSADGFIDSGNQLTDPFTKKPVIICDEAFLLHWFEKNEWDQLKKSYQQLEMDHLPEGWEDHLRIIPFQGVEGGNGFIFCLRAEELLILYGNQEIKTSNFLVGIQFGSLTRDGSYHCLLQPELIQSAVTYSA
jgi:stage II sporulation protein GA (sporulation sigma-E factor processing peptidase)